ncbi:MAG: hypothetical protein JEZ06_09150 [Anaerolineaceae bacterium]|nr:hypothetical protein [Anaerolineaceae bacterium]
MKVKIPLLIVSLLLLLVAAGCGGAEQNESETDVSVIVSLTQTAAALQAPAEAAPTEVSAQLGEADSSMARISGQAYGVAPPTPEMTLYAVDLATGVWAYLETQKSVTITSFEFEVPPGEYILFAHPLGLGYSQDGLTLSTVKISEGETITDIQIRPPSQDECGATFGIPASPDGVFEEIVAGQYCAEDAYYVPIPEKECTGLYQGLVDSLRVDGESAIKPFINYMIEEEGTGCEMRFSGTGVNFSGNAAIMEVVSSVMYNFDYLENEMLFMVGGPTADSTGFQQGNRECQFTTYWEPVDINLCPDDQPISSCKLEPDQIQYHIILNCAEAPLESVAMPKTEPERISFDTGAISAQLFDSITSGGLIPYVIFAMEGQQMQVELQTDGNLILEIWGMDGAVLISTHVGAKDWVGELPASQDYFIDVISTDQSVYDYTLNVTILPKDDGDDSLIKAGDLQDLMGSGVPVLLPAAFPEDELAVYIMSIFEGEYEISLDYGVECRGAGACHYGILTGKQVNSDSPEDTYSFPFETEQAEVVTLMHDIPGWYVDFSCGANCNDAKVYWILNGYQYIAGIKAGSREQVIALANSVLENAIQ